MWEFVVGSWSGGIRNYAEDIPTVFLWEWDCLHLLRTLCQREKVAKADGIIKPKFPE